MPYCPNCNFEYLPHIARCPDCGAPLLDGSSAEPAHPPNIPLVRLCTLHDPSEAEIVTAALSEAGIRTLIRRQGPITGELGRVTDGITDDYAIILVPEDKLPDAQRLLAELQSGPIQWPEGMEPDESEEDDD